MLFGGHTVKEFGWWLASVDRKSLETWIGGDEEEEMETLERTKMEAISSVAEKAYEVNFMAIFQHAGAVV